MRNFAKVLLFIFAVGVMTSVVLTIISAALVLEHVVVTEKK